MESQIQVHEGTSNVFKGTEWDFDMTTTQSIEEIKVEYEEWSDYKIKQEVYEDDNPRSITDDNSICSFADMMSFDKTKIINKEELCDNNNVQDNNNGYFINVNMKDEIKKYQVTIKTERLEDDQEELLDTVEYKSLHYDSLVIPGKVECKWCYRIFKNNYDLYKHNTVHIKLNLNVVSPNIKSRRPRKYKRNEIFHCEYCNSRMKHDNWQRHMETVHSTEEFSCDLCEKRFRCVKYLKKHMLTHGQAKRAVVKDNSVTCEECGKVFKHKYNLYCHVKNCHSHEELECDMCDGVFKSKPYLMQHVKRIHQDYGRLFVCWCGKDFLTPRRLSYHKRNQHGFP